MAKRTAKATESVLSVEDDLTSLIAQSLNKQFKSSHAKVAYTLDEDTSSDITNWVSTGSSILDLAISNRPNGGFPVGRITEITGMEQSGKSLLAAHALANTQKMGGIAVLIDSESAISKEFLQAIGVDLKTLIYIPLELIEEVFEAIENIVNYLISNNIKDKIITIVVDSVAGTSTKQEMEADYDKDGWATSKAIILSKAMRKVTNFVSKSNICLIMTNQLRTKMSVTFGDNMTTSGGKAVAYHSSVRLRLASAGQIKVKIDGREEIVGATTRAKVIKNRCGPPLRTADYDIYYDSGIDDYGQWLVTLRDRKLVTESGNSYIYTVKSTGEEIKFTSKKLKTLLNSNPEFRASMYDDICEALITKYKAGEDFGIDDVTITTDEPGEES